MLNFHIISLALAVCASALGDTISTGGSPKLIYATYVTSGHALAVDQDGFAYFGGRRTGFGGTSCAALTKLSQDGTSILWTTCLPGGEVADITIDSQGFLYVALVPGSTSSDDQSILAKLTSDGQQFIYKTAIAGAQVRKIVVGENGAVFATGIAGGRFKPTPGAFATGSIGQSFALRIDPSGALSYATRLDLITATGIATDRAGNAWIVGKSCYNATGDPAITCDTTRTGTASAIRKLDESGGRLTVAKTFGGGQVAIQGGYLDHADGVASGAGDTVWVIGFAHSPSVPTTPNGAVPELSDRALAPFIIQLTSIGDSQYGTYLRFGDPASGTSLSANAITVDVAGKPYLATWPGVLTLDDATLQLFPTNDAAGLAPITLDGKGGLYGIGSCLTTPGAYKPFPSGSGDGCVTKLDLTKVSAGRILGQLNAASHLPNTLPNTTIAPGEMLLLIGQNLPANPIVTFGDIPAPVLASDSATITTVVPFELNASWTTIRVEGTDGGLNLLTSSYAPGLFTSDGSGRGQLDAYNSDGTANSSANPAAAGSIVTVFLTGAGAMVPAIADGALGPVEPPYAAPVAPVYITVNGAPGNTVFVGQAAGKIAGVVRVDFRIPVSTVPGDALVRVGVGTTPAENTVQPITTVVVQ